MLMADTMTEGEAAEKWCPMVRAQHFEPRPDKSNPAVNRPANNFPCIGSRCMMWRWAHWQNARLDLPDKAKVGFCGLAGVPDVEQFSSYVEQRRAGE